MPAHPLITTIVQRLETRCRPPPCGYVMETVSASSECFSSIWSIGRGAGEGDTGTKTPLNCNEEEEAAMTTFLDRWSEAARGLDGSSVMLALLVVGVVVPRGRGVEG